MAYAITLWLAFVLAAGAICWFAPRAAIPFAVVATIMLPASFTTLGRAAPWEPLAGTYAVLGARIDVDETIYVLVDVTGDEPRFYRFPYSAEEANDLLAAMDGDDGILMEIGGDGSRGFSDGVLSAEEPKRAERALIQ